MAYIVSCFGRGYSYKIFLTKEDALEYYDDLCRKDVRRSKRIYLVEQVYARGYLESQKPLFHSSKTDRHYGKYRNIRDRLRAKSSKTKKVAAPFGL